VAGKMRSFEKSSDLIGIRSCDLPACSAVRQSTTLCSCLKIKLTLISMPQTRLRQDATHCEATHCSSGYIVTDEKLERCGQIWPWSTLRYCPGIFRARMKNTLD
jgi:hypothetical protein